MDLKFSAEDEAFRADVREWMEANAPRELRSTASSRNTQPRAIRMKLYEGLKQKGWMCPRWPGRFGGPGFSPSQQVVFDQEMNRVGAPNFDLGVWMVAPLIMEHGTEEQQQRYLPKMLAAEELWCQGYSEPGAGSDLAALSIRAEIEDDAFIVNGRKVWTSTAYEVDRMFMLARTDPTAERRQQGISFLLVDMKLPGITVNRIHMINDEESFCEVSFEDVRVPRDCLLGGLNQGWTLAKQLLSHERSGNLTGEMIRRLHAALVQYAGSHNENGGALIDNPTTRRALASMAMKIDAACYLGYRNLTRFLKGEPPGPESSVLKVYASELMQEICDSSAELQGPVSQVWQDPNFDEEDTRWPPSAVWSRSTTIAGGTSEVQRNIIAERVLGMPR